MSSRYYTRRRQRKRGAIAQSPGDYALMPKDRTLPRRPDRPPLPFEARQIDNAGLVPAGGNEAQ